MLCDKLEEKMKGTVVDGTIKMLFEGKSSQASNFPPIAHQALVCRIP